MEGWIKLHRKFLNWEWYNDNNVKIVFIHLLLVANHTDQKWKGVIIKRGQRLTSIGHLAKEVNLTVQQTRTAVNKLKSTGEITIETTNKNTLVTIANYDFYQVEENIITSNKTNKTTIEQQTNNKQITINKNDKNVNNDKNVTTTVGDSCVDGLQSIIDFYQDNIGLITPYAIEVFTDYEKEMDKELIVLAMKKAVEANKRTIQYIKGILNNWSKQGIKTVLDAEQEDRRFREKDNKAEIIETKEERIARLKREWGVEDEN